MLIIVDYDETFTANKALFSKIIDDFKESGATVICCTMRVGNPYVDRDVIEDMEKLSVPIVFAATHKDKLEAVEKAGYIPENAIWIDDSPYMIWMNRTKQELLDVI